MRKLRLTACKNECKLDTYTQICYGCGRTLQEIIDAGINANRKEEERADQFS